MKKKLKSNIASVKKIEDIICLIRGHRVILDVDLAELYGVKTKRLNEQVKRNTQRFPPQFMFQLTQEEKLEVVAFCDHLEKLKFSKSTPYAFTEHGALMVANVLKSEKAIATSIQVVEAFIQLRYFISSHKQLVQEINSLKNFVLKNAQSTTQEFRKVWSAIEKLMISGKPKSQRRIGFDLEKCQK